MGFFDLFDEPRRARPRFTVKEKDALFKQQGGKCNGCGKKFDLRNLAVDHIRPFLKGGGERLNNLQLLCTACNSLKGDGTMAQLKRELVKQGVIKPPPSKGAGAGRSRTSARQPQSTKRPVAKKRSTRKPRDPIAELFGF